MSPSSPVCKSCHIVLSLSISASIPPLSQPSSLLTLHFLSLCVLQPQSLQASVQARTIRNKGIVHTKMKITTIYSCLHVIPSPYGLLSFLNTKQRLGECSHCSIEGKYTAPNSTKQYKNNQKHHKCRLYVDDDVCMIHLIQNRFNLGFIQIKT